MQPISIAIVDDNQIVRDNIAQYLNSVPNFRCNVVAQSIAEFILQSDKISAPDIVLLDIGMPDIDGIEGIAHIKKNYKNISIIMLSVYDDNRKIFNALCAGAVGYLQKKYTT